MTIPKRENHFEEDWEEPMRNPISVRHALAACVVVVMLVGCATTPDFARSPTALTPGTSAAPNSAYVNAAKTLGHSETSFAARPDIPSGFAPDRIIYTPANVQIESSSYSLNLKSYGSVVAPNGNRTRY
jgi:hypothetical protein